MLMPSNLYSVWMKKFRNAILKANNMMNKLDDQWVQTKCLGILWWQKLICTKNFWYFLKNLKIVASWFTAIVKQIYRDFIYIKKRYKEKNSICNHYSHRCSWRRNGNSKTLKTPKALKTPFRKFNPCTFFSRTLLFKQHEPLS